MPRPIDQAQFRRTLGHFPTGVVVVASPGPVGIAIGSFASLSLDPPLVTFSVNKTSSSWAGMRDTGVLCVSVLADDQEDISRAFAQSGTDKFAGVGWTAAASGSPRINNCVAWMDCDLHAVYSGGDHHIAIAEVREMAVEREAKPLVFFRGGYGI